jgi:hypothetical protein
LLNSFKLVSGFTVLMMTSVNGAAKHLVGGKGLKATSLRVGGESTIALSLSLTCADVAAVSSDP